jgi:hypothetical protein
MSPPHFLAFVGASYSLSEELRKIRGNFPHARLLASAAKASQRGITQAAVNRVVAEVVVAIKTEGQLRPSVRLSVWAYEPTEQSTFQIAWNAFGRAGWVEFIPANLRDKDRQTRMYIEARLKFVESIVHEISDGVYNRRRSSPLPIPFANFKSMLMSKYRTHWYRKMDIPELKSELSALQQRFRQQHIRQNQVFSDDRDLQFSPAKPEACHGRPHPIGDLDVCYVNGNFRFGAALFPGHHYDVRKAHGPLDCVLYNCDSTPRDMKAERLNYVNIFPNDHLLPERS